MDFAAYIAVFTVGLLGGVHCVGMCGGIVSALSVNTPRLPGRSRLAELPIHLAYNLGRITSYTLAGALLGAIGSLGLLLENFLPVQIGLYVLANLMLVALGLYLTGVTASLAFLERQGQKLWRRIQPFTRRFLPANSPFQALPLGMLWGFLPCGMVYSVLTTALLSGSSVKGAGLMLAFGLGTLPNLMLAGMLAKRLQEFTRRKAVRLVAGLLVLAFGLFGLMNATTLGGRLWQGVICHT